VAERGRRDGGVWPTGMRRDARQSRERIPIGKRVSQVHLDHFCPGGVGLPVTGSGPIGLAPAEPEPDSAGPDPTGWESNIARAAGENCGRCGQPVTSDQDARKRVGGTWVHEACPG
jgi:hypothetical protein